VECELRAHLFRFRFWGGVGGLQVIGDARGILVGREEGRRLGRGSGDASRARSYAEAVRGGLGVHARVRSDVTHPGAGAARAEVSRPDR
jgi:hypothetical protein